MLPARTTCPQCRSQILKFYESGYRRIFPAAPARSSRQFATARTTVSRLLIQQTSARNLSTTRRALQDVESTTTAGNAQDVISVTAAGNAQDIETLVRQARQTFGHTLPEGFLSEEEYVVYERLFGPPVRSTRPEDVGIHLIPGENDAAEQNKRVLFRETEAGTLEEVDYIPEPAAAADVQVKLSKDGTVAELPPLTDAQLHYLAITANNEREYNALAELQREFDVAKARPVEEEEQIDEPEEEEEDEEDDEYEDDEGEPGAQFQVGTEERFGPRLHEHTVAGQFKTDPATIFLPHDEFTEPIAKLLNRTDTTHIRQAAEKVFGGPGLPYSTATPESKKNLPMKPIQMEAGFHRMSEIDADTFIATILPAMYATAMSTLVEVRKRIGSSWIKDMLQTETGPRVLDVGGGGAALAAWQEVLQAEWQALRDRGEVSGREPRGRKTVVVGSDNLRHRISTFLHNTTFLPRLPDYLHSGEAASGTLLHAASSPQPRKTFDLIIASHALLPLNQPHKRKQLIDNLWTMLNPQGGVLIVLEKGHPRGFEAIADVRERLLDEFIIPPGPQPAPAETTPSAKEPGMIIAPCTNHTKCPMYHTPGLSAGRKDFCHFSQRFIRPAFLQRVVGASHRSHEDVKFSFLAVRRGEHPSPLATSPEANRSPFLQGAKATDLAFEGYEKKAGSSSYASLPPHPLSLPRNILPPLKRRGHVTLDLCTPAGAIERWTVPRSFSKQAYHDARKARWGDLWALGAKTRVRRQVRLGKRKGQAAAAAADGAEAAKKGSDNRFGGGKQQQPGGNRRNKVVELTVEPGKGVVGARMKGTVEPGRRTKAGRNRRVEDLLEELGMHEDDEIDEEFDEIMGVGKKGSGKGKKVKGHGLE